MTTVTGPVTIGATNTNWGSAVTLCFTASNWSSTYNSGLVTTGEALRIETVQPEAKKIVEAAAAPVIKTTNGKSWTRK